MTQRAQGDFPSPALQALALRGDRLRIDFLSTELDLSLTLASLASTDRDLGLNQSAERCVAMAWRGYHSALDSLQKVRGDDGTLETLRARVNDLHQTLKQFENVDQVGQTARHLNGHAKPGKPLEVDELTQREGEVLKLIVDGNSTKQIAVQLGIAFKTAACHRSRIMSKLSTQNTAALVRSAIRLGLVEL
jgi:DNA-binding CsgD family transcriptional regulator